jgi:hypothetical protein
MPTPTPEDGGAGSAPPGAPLEDGANGNVTMGLNSDGATTLSAPIGQTPWYETCIPPWAPIICVETQFSFGGSLSAPNALGVAVDFDPINGSMSLGAGIGNFGLSVVDRQAALWNAVDYEGWRNNLSGPYNRHSSLGSVTEANTAASMSWSLPMGTYGLSVSVTADLTAPFAIPDLAVRSWRTVRIGGGISATYWLEQHTRAIWGRDAANAGAISASVAVAYLARLLVIDELPGSLRVAWD